MYLNNLYVCSCFALVTKNDFADRYHCGSETTRLIVALFRVMWYEHTCRQPREGSFLHFMMIQLLVSFY